MPPTRHTITPKPRPANCVLEIWTTSNTISAMVNPEVTIIATLAQRFRIINQAKMAIGTLG